ncbi:TetR/AcrR family transcriptional regulator [Nocardioides sp. DS6]|uniref:TetR/AcrR family transcriptional regulator n=1 Tax=Nocardioides eburneus TaxID=3231482 RepID=A0ABV3SY04_9ACTN
MDGNELAAGVTVDAADLPARAPRRWSRTVKTRASILAAAREVFLEHGFAEANVSDVVDRSGLSVGSIYHHFGGKAELYVALWEDHEEALHDASSRAIQAERAAGEQDPLQLFIAGARAYLERAWFDHAMARVFLSGDSPPGFEALRRARGQDWIRENAQLLRAADEPVARVLVLVLTSIVGDGAREVCGLDSRSEAEQIIEATLGFIHKVAS